jgi:hypothetical protein
MDEHAPRPATATTIAKAVKIRRADEGIALKGRSPLLLLRNNRNGFTSINASTIF